MNKEEKYNKIKGSVYGLAIGDAMGATTEFMHHSEVKRKHGTVDKIIGGGWLNIKPGSVTDDTELMLCVANAMQGATNTREFLNNTTGNFMNWFNNDPIDVGNTTKMVLDHFDINPTKQHDFNNWFERAENRAALGNGSLTRALAPCLTGNLEWTIKQGRLTHNNTICDVALKIYFNLIRLAMKNGYMELMEFTEHTKCEPTGHVLNTLHNGSYWFNSTNSFEDAIIGVVNDGGDADSIAAVTGSISGAYYGYDAINKEWIKSLSIPVKKELDKVSKMIEKISNNGLQI